MEEVTSRTQRQAGTIKGQGGRGKEKRAIELIIRAYNKLLEDKRYPTMNYEVWYSAILVGYMNEMCSVYARETKLQWYVTREYVNDSLQVRMGLADPNSVPRIDINIACWQGPGGTRYKYSFECKRLIEGDTDLLRLYIEKGLVDRYLTAKDYAAGGSWGGMIGYILKGSYDTIVVKLNEQIDRQINRASDHLVLADPVAGFEAIYKSQHQRPESTNILTITHLLLTLHIPDVENEASIIDVEASG